MRSDVAARIAESRRREEQRWEQWEQQMGKKLWQKIRDIPPEGEWRCSTPEAEFQAIALEMIHAGIDEEQALAWLKRAYDAAQV